MTTDEMTEGDLPPMPDFDPRRTRRAVRRGLVRTTSMVLAALTVVALAATLGSTAVQKRGDRQQRMTDVLGTAFKIYNPAYSLYTEHCCDATSLSLSFTVSGRPIRAAGGFTGYGGSGYTITQDFFGRVGRLPLGNSANTTLSTALANVRTGNQPADSSRKVLARLPEELNALAVVEFDRPLEPDELVRFGRDHGACPEKVVYEQRPRAIPITWGLTTWERAPLPDSGMCYETSRDFVRNFRAWTGLLRDHDDANLRHFDLTLDRLRKAADDGLAYAYVDNLVTVGKLRKLIDDPRVRTVRVADVTYDLERP